MDADDKKLLKNGVKILGELVLPGTSLLMEEKVKLGVAHAGVALAAKAALGVPAVALVAANSLSMSMTGRGLVANLLENTARQKDPRDVTLTDKVVRDVKSGMTFEEIRADVLEDIEDLYHEVVAKVQQVAMGGAPEARSGAGVETPAQGQAQGPAAPPAGPAAGSGNGGGTDKT